MAQLEDRLCVGYWEGYLNSKFYMSKQKILQEFLETTVSKLDMFESSYTKGDTKSLEVSQIIRDSGCGAILVIDQNDKLQGIITERDLLKKFKDTNNFTSLTANDLMTKSPEAHKRNTSLARLLYDCSEKGYRHIPIVHAQSFPEYIVTSQNIVTFLCSHFITEAGAYVKNILEQDKGYLSALIKSPIKKLKPQKPISINNACTLKQAINLMNSKNIGSLIVTDSNNHIDGILTEADFTNKVFSNEDINIEKSVLPYFTPEPNCIAIDTTVQEALNILANGNFRHLPVKDSNNHCVGILSVRNFIKHLANAIMQDIDHAKK